MEKKPITKADLLHGIQLRDLAIADAVKRIQSNPTDTRYVAMQNAKIETWEMEKGDFEEQIKRMA